MNCIDSIRDIYEDDSLKNNLTLPGFFEKLDLSFLDKSHRIQILIVTIGMITMLHAPIRSIHGMAARHIIPAPRGLHARVMSEQSRKKSPALC